MNPPKVGSAWRHKNGITYIVLGFATFQCKQEDDMPSWDGAMCIRYRSPQGAEYVRPIAEFQDGRFVEL